MDGGWEELDLDENKAIFLLHEPFFYEEATEGNSEDSIIGHFKSENKFLCTSEVYG